MERNFQFTKNHTLAAKGIAILFLVCYHCFSSEKRFYGAEVSFAPLSLEMGIAISKGMAICVGLFVFLSVYGMTRSMAARFENYEFTPEQGGLYVIRRYISVIAMFFIPFLFCQLVTALKGFHRYGVGIAERIGNFFLDMLGFSDIFGTKMLVDTWWYMSLLVMITVFMPVLIRAYKNYSWLFVVMFLVFCQVFVDLDTNMTRWLFVVPVAIVTADQNILERLREWQWVDNPVANKTLKFLVSTLVVAGLFLLRSSGWGMSYGRFVISGILPLVFIYWGYEFIFELPIIGTILRFLGHHSADIFFVHNCIRGIWYKDQVYSLSHAVLIFLVVMGGSLILSMLFDVIRRLVDYNSLIKKITNKVLTWAEKNLYKSLPQKGKKA